MEAGASTGVQGEILRKRKKEKIHCFQIESERFDQDLLTKHRREISTLTLAQDSELDKFF